MRAYLRNRLYVPMKYVTDEHLSEFTHTLVNKDCEKCKEKDTDSCLDCPNSEPTEVYTYKRYKGYYAFCRGDLAKIYRVFRKFDIIEETCIAKAKYGLIFTNNLWDNQKETVKKWLEYKYGIIKSPPRSGKTVIACYLICKSKKKTIVLAHDRTLLDQFYGTFMEHTNLEFLRKINKTKNIVGITNCRKDLEEYDVCLTTYQSFIRDLGKEYVQELKNTFGFVVCDEVHLSAADCYRKVVDTLNAKYRLGLTATPKRKDNLECITYDILGNVTAVGKSDEMHCNVIFHSTGYKVKPFRQWNSLVKQLSKSVRRNNIICNIAEKDVNSGRYVLIVTMRIEHIDTLAKNLSDRGLRVLKYDGRIPKGKRKKVLDEAREGQYDVVVAMRKMIKLGVDCSRWDTYNYIMPLAFEENYYQEMSRIRTPYSKKLVKKLGKEKDTPLIRVFCDYGHGSIYACLNIIDKVHKRQKFTFINAAKELEKEKTLVKKMKW